MLIPHFDRRRMRPLLGSYVHTSNYASFLQDLVCCDVNEDSQFPSREAKHQQIPNVVTAIGMPRTPALKTPLKYIWMSDGLWSLRANMEGIRKSEK